MQPLREIEISTRSDAAISAWHEGRKNDAIVELRTLRDEFPNESRVAFMLGAYLWNAGRPQESIQHLKYAVRSHPEQELWSRILYHSLWETGRVEDAAECLRALLAIRKVSDLEQVLRDLEAYVEDTAS